MKWIAKTRTFSRWMRKTELTNAILLNAVDEMECGLVDADLGGGIVKKRIPLPGRGKSGSTRTLIATNKHNRWIFLFGFEKKDRENVHHSELLFLQSIASDWLCKTSKEIALAIKNGELEDVHHE